MCLIAEKVRTNQTRTAKLNKYLQGAPQKGAPLLCITFLYTCRNLMSFLLDQKQIQVEF